MLQVNTNGAISFSSAVSSFASTAFPLDGSRKLVAPYWSDVDTRGTGTIYYHESILNELLTRASEEIRNAFPANQFSATMLFIVTWDHVGYYNSRTDRVRVEMKMYIMSNTVKTHRCFTDQHIPMCSYYRRSSIICNILIC